MRRYHLIIALIGAFAVAGCAGDDGSSKPDDLIDAETMAEILTEIHLAESQVGRYALSSSDSTKLLFDRLNTRILKKFEVDTSAYRMSYIYYSSHPDKLEAIYKEVTGTLEKMANPGSTSAVSGSAQSGSTTSGSVTSGSTTSGSATSGSATTGSVTSGSTTSGSAASGLGMSRPVPSRRIVTESAMPVSATGNLGTAMKEMSKAKGSTRAFLRRRQ